MAVSDATTETEPAEQQESSQQAPTAEQAETAGNGAAGSDNLLIEVDGKLVPNYDATIHPFSEGDVVSGGRWSGSTRTRCWWTSATSRRG